ncbi:MAG: Hsp70 family protein, partial [Pseudomonadota bacterium]
VQWLIGEFRRSQGIDVSSDRVVLQRLRDAAERAKLDLSSITETEINLPFLVADATGPKHLQCTLTRPTFEKLAMELFEETFKECRMALDDAGLGPNDLDEVILVGGSSRIPRIQEMARNLFKCPLNKSFNPDEVVAVGAAIQGAMLGGEVKAVTLLDVTNYSLGIEVEGHRMACLIPKNTTIPTVTNQLVSTVVDNQKVVRIHVLQGENPIASDNVSLGEFELHSISAAPRGVPRIEVRFAIDVDGIVNVSARDQRSGRSEEITIANPAAIGPQKHVEEQAHEEAVEGDPHLAALRGKVERELVNLEALLREQRGKLHQKDIFELELALKRGRMALLKSVEAENLEELLVYLQRFLEHVQGKLGKGVASLPIH